LSLQAAARRQLRLPPFAHDVVADPARAVWVSAGPGAWARARRWRSEKEPGLVLPPGEDPGAYQWPVHGLNVALIATDMPEDDVAQILLALQRGGAVVVAILYGPSDNTRMELVVNGRNG
jgi:hypothetical protein